METKRSEKSVARFYPISSKIPSVSLEAISSPLMGFETKGKKEREKKEKRSSCGENKQSFSLLNPVLSSENYFLSAIQISPFWN